jgi:hypothetical protein
MRPAPRVAENTALSRRFARCGFFGGSVAKAMQKISYSGYRFPPEIIHQAVWLYLMTPRELRSRRYWTHFGPDKSS